ncbi:MAG: hypothetical protein KAI66_16605, partial [Lentisphaeria bacterium]|nr:hypothetical protein [Lentisphaeria bacterium]
PCAVGANDLSFLCARSALSPFPPRTGTSAAGGKGESWCRCTGKHDLIHQRRKVAGVLSWHGLIHQRRKVAGVPLKNDAGGWSPVPLSTNDARSLGSYHGMVLSTNDAEGWSPVPLSTNDARSLGFRKQQIPLGLLDECLRQSNV